MLRIWGKAGKINDSCRAPRIECCFQDDTLKVVNPAYRQLAGQIKSQAARLARKHIEFSPITLGEQLHEKEIATYESKKAALRETIEDMETRLEQLKRNRKETPRQSPSATFPNKSASAASPPRENTSSTPSRSSPTGPKPPWPRTSAKPWPAPTDDPARCCAKSTQAARISCPDPKNKTLTIRLHHLANPLSGKAARHLAALLNQTEQGYPGTNLRLIYNWCQNPIPEIRISDIVSCHRGESRARHSPVRPSAPLRAPPRTFTRAPPLLEHPAVYLPLTYSIWLTPEQSRRQSQYNQRR